jgi:hypothetical protein
VDGSVDLTAFLSWTPTDLPAGGVLIAASRPAEAPTPVAASSLVASDLKPVFAVGGHPLTAGLDLAGVVVRATSPLTVPAWAEPILMAEDVPIAYAGERPEGRVVVLGFDVEDPDSGFAKRPAFPVLIARAVDWLAPLPPGAVPAGDWVDLPGGDHEVTAPDGSTATVSRRVRADSAGLYLARAGDSAVELLRFGAWAGRGGGDVPEGQDWDAARAAVAGGSPDREGASGISASSIGPELATLALVLVLAEGLWRGLGHERPPSVVRPAASRPDPQPGGRP